MGQGCQGDLACGQGQRWSLSAYMGRKKRGRRDMNGGQHTRWFHSGDPVLTCCVKKRRQGKEEEKTLTGLSKTRGEKRENFIFP